MEDLHLELRPFGGESTKYDLSDANISGNHGGGEVSIMRITVYTP